MGVSRIEYSLDKIVPKLTKRIFAGREGAREWDKNFTVNKYANAHLGTIKKGKYSDLKKRNLIFSFHANIYALTKDTGGIKDYTKDEAKKLIVDYNVAYDADKIALQLFRHFGHSSKFDGKSYHNWNMDRSVHYSVLQMFSNSYTRPFEPTSEELILAKELSSNIFFNITVDLSLIDSKYNITRIENYLYPFKQDFHFEESKPIFEKDLIYSELMD